MVPPPSLSLPQWLSFCCVVSAPASLSLLRWLDDTTLLPAALLTGECTSFILIFSPSSFSLLPPLLSSFIHQPFPVRHVLCFIFSSSSLSFHLFKDSFIPCHSHSSSFSSFPSSPTHLLIHITLHRLSAVLSWLSFYFLKSG